MIRGFFAYPSRPDLLAETIREACHMINQQVPDVQIRPWQKGHVVGKLIIHEICRDIDECNLFLADLTGMNPSVMFELGYAVGRKKRIWIVLDSTNTAAKRDYEQLQILTGVGYAPYRNSQELMLAFIREQPNMDLGNSIFSTGIEPGLLPGEDATLLYLRSQFETEADRRLAELVARYQKTGLPATIDDPREARVNPLAWYGQKAYSAVALLAHLSGPRHDGWAIHNARHAFVSGLAYGLTKAILMLAEEDYEVPFDFRDMLIKYKTTKECIESARDFLERVRGSYEEQRAPRELHLKAIQLATELKSLRLGEYVAENEADQLAGYFVETAAYREALEGHHMIFVGRRGSGKTANLIRISTVLADEKRNLVVTIMPAGYDLEALARLLKRYREKDAKGYLVESIWKYLLYSELARAATDAINERLYAGLSPQEEQLVEFVQAERSLLQDDFAVRLERAVDALLPLKEHVSIEATRLAISEALHEGQLKTLRALLGPVLERRGLIAILLDNLDKAWETNGDLDHLSEFLLGLLIAAREMPADFRRIHAWRRPVRLGITIFLRSEIFYRLMRVAREPDKILYSKITWDDPEILNRIIESRFLASQPESMTDPSELWHRYFSHTIKGIPTKEYLAGSVLPRPRDIIYLTKAAVSIAVNRGHARVEEQDVLDATKLYSQHAFEAVEAEGKVTFPKIREILYEFLGASEVLTVDQLSVLLGKAHVDHIVQPDVIDHLCALSFLGVEIRPSDFAFSIHEDERHKYAVMARNFAEASHSPARYRINPAYWNYLEIRSQA